MLLILKTEKIIEINIAITPNIGADNKKNKPKLKNKNPNLKELSSFETWFNNNLFKLFFENIIEKNFLQSYI